MPPALTGTADAAQDCILVFYCRRGANNNIDAFVDDIRLQSKFRVVETNPSHAWSLPPNPIPVIIGVQNPFPPMLMTNMLHTCTEVHKGRSIRRRRQQAGLSKGNSCYRTLYRRKLDALHHWRKFFYCRRERALPNDAFGSREQARAQRNRSTCCRQSVFWWNNIRSITGEEISGGLSKAGGVVGRNGGRVDRPLRTVWPVSKAGGGGPKRIFQNASNQSSGRGYEPSGNELHLSISFILL
ncbi:hypothetical protein T07_6737 [Trichinella nelsoni]|uniref:Uncharacterized protein n=1 Tax=Trichinella nelsoni TaxID=6336 RepID=A0A0V0RTB7_9BILA|nr:hypothetical protein T07_6737 [Trichinella nelsoni]